MKAIEIKKIHLNNLQQLQEVSRETFIDTFGKENEEENLMDYLANAYNDARLSQELENPESDFFFLYEESQLAGYLKLNVGKAQTEEMSENSLEIERIYIRKAFKRKGYGATLIQFAISEALKKEKKMIWLGVWEKNAAALAFYRKMGFFQEGAHTFQLGSDIQTDFIMKKSLL